MEEKYRYYFSPFVRETLGTLLVGNDAFVPLPITHVDNGYTSKKVMCDYKSIVTPVKHINASDEVVWHMMKRQPKSADLTKGFPTQRVPVNGNIPRIVENIKDMDLPQDERTWLSQYVYQNEPNEPNAMPAPAANAPQISATNTAIYGQNTRFLDLGNEAPALERPLEQMEGRNTANDLMRRTREQINIFERMMRSQVPEFESAMNYTGLTYDDIMKWLNYYNPVMSDKSYTKWLEKNPLRNPELYANQNVYTADPLGTINMLMTSLLQSFQQVRAANAILVDDKSSENTAMPPASDGEIEG